MEFKFFFIFPCFHLAFLFQDTFDHDKGQKSANSGRRLHWIFGILSSVFFFVSFFSRSTVKFSKEMAPKCGYGRDGETRVLRVWAISSVKRGGSRWTGAATGVFSAPSLQVLPARSPLSPVVPPPLPYCPRQGLVC